MKGGRTNSLLEGDFLCGSEAVLCATQRQHEIAHKTITKETTKAFFELIVHIFTQLTLEYVNNRRPAAQGYPEVWHENSKHSSSLFKHMGFLAQLRKIQPGKVCFKLELNGLLRNFCTTIRF